MSHLATVHAVRCFWSTVSALRGLHPMTTIKLAFNNERLPIFSYYTLLFCVNGVIFSPQHKSVFHLAEKIEQCKIKSWIIFFPKIFWSQRKSIALYLLKCFYHPKIFASPASSCTSPRSTVELEIHTVGSTLKHHITNIEINTKWRNNSSGDRDC